MVWSAVIGAVGSALGAREANADARREARRNRQFQKMMSDTAVRRRMVDLRAAGINPILAAGQSASTPGGAVAPVQDEIAGAVNTAIALRQQAQELKNMKSADALLKAQRGKEIQLTDESQTREQGIAINNRLGRLETERAEMLKPLDRRLYSGTKGALLRAAQLASSPVNSAASVGRLFK